MSDDQFESDSGPEAPFDARLRAAARELNVPPETPRDRMWERISAARAGRRHLRPVPGGRPDAARRWRRLPSPLLWGAGIAAALAIGVGIGRHSAERPAPEIAAAPAARAARAVPGRTAASDATYRLVTLEHLSQSEAFLTLFRASLGRDDQPLAAPTARQLLATNRLLLDSRASADPKTRLLLQDLELVLAEIAQLAPRPRAQELDLITAGMERNGVMVRLRSVVPAGAGILNTGGAL